MSYSCVCLPISVSLLSPLVSIWLTHVYPDFLCKCHHLGRVPAARSKYDWWQLWLCKPVFFNRNKAYHWPFKDNSPKHKKTKVDRLNRIIPPPLPSSLSSQAVLTVEYIQETEEDDEPGDELIHIIVWPVLGGVLLLIVIVLLLYYVRHLACPLWCDIAFSSITNYDVIGVIN